MIIFQVYHTSFCLCHGSYDVESCANFVALTQWEVGLRFYDICPERTKYWDWILANTLHFTIDKNGQFYGKINVLSTEIYLYIQCRICVTRGRKLKGIDVDGFVQDCSNSMANALDLLQSCTKPSIWLTTGYYPDITWNLVWRALPSCCCG